ncbi:MAG: hypothetical protein GQ557_02300 [Mycoplasmataceae bacterium]|nr:hypothetical protein [Mycoplasmataceae bacterium]
MNSGLLEDFDKTGTLNFDKNIIESVTVKKLENGNLKAYFFSIYDFLSGKARWFILEGSGINQYPTTSLLENENYNRARKGYKLAQSKCKDGRLLQDFEIPNGSESQCYTIILGTPSSKKHANRHLYELSSNEKDELLLKRNGDGVDDIEAMNFEDSTSIEGAKIERKSIAYERDPKLRAKAIGIHGLICAVCGFDFKKFYGQIGKNFIEIHHLKPLSLRESSFKTDPKNDLIPICSNCHRMIHRKHGKVLSVSELKLEITNNMKNC